MNTAIPKLRIGRGIDAAVYAATGEKQLLTEWKIGEITPGNVACADASYKQGISSILRDLHGLTEATASGRSCTLATI